jgi:uncharacterized protein
MRSQELITRLGMQRHPERGYFVETYRSALSVHSALHDGDRNCSTAIYFLLDEKDRCTFLHRLRSDELFHLYEGGPLHVLLLPPFGPGRVEQLGTDFASGQRPQLVIPAGTWFATELPVGASHCLWGCTVSPGFDFADFELAQGPELAARFPECAASIARMSRPSRNSEG